MVLHINLILLKRAKLFILPFGEKRSTANGTQQEHMDIANECKEIFIEQFPAVSEALEWVESAE